MSLDERYIVSSDIEQYYVDKDSGLPLAGGTLEFFRDVARSTPKVVYQLSGSPPNYTYTSMGAVITLSAVGTVQNSGGDNEVIYYFPFDSDGNLDLYYIVVRDSNGVEQFSREAWPNVTSGNNPVTEDNTNLSNQLANPQFAQVFLNEGFTTTYTVSAATNQVFAFAPDWDFVISGTGTVVIQRIAIAGNDHVPTSPPYVLDVTVSGGITSCLMRQRLAVNSGLWASTANQPIFLSGTLVARNQLAGTTGIQMFYAPSSGGSPVVIVDESFDNSAYKVLRGTSAAAIPTSTDTNSGNDGYVDVYLSFLIGSHVRISSIQVLPTTDQAGGNLIGYDLNSSNREEALLGDYYLPNLNIKPMPSLLTAWDFQLNPFQLGASGNIGATAAYITDQTIALRGATGNVAFARNAVTNGLQLTTADNNDAFYLMQYLSGAQARKLLGTKLSVNVFGYITSVSDAVTMRVYLFRAATATVIPTLPTSIGTVATDGVFTLTALNNWTEIPRGGLDTAKALMPVITASTDLNLAEVDTPFTGWQLTDAAQITDTDKFAIVVTFAYIDASTVAVINSVSLTPNAIPCRPAPQTPDQVLQECQFYYEKSYATGTTAGTATDVNEVFAEQIAFHDSAGAGTNSGYARGFSLRYNTIKRVAISPGNLLLYDPSAGTAGNVLVSLTNGNSGVVPDVVVALSHWTLINSNTKGFSYFGNGATVPPGYIITSSPDTALFPECYIRFHYTADARLGIV